jgi:nitroimidazol reductase NimA-like FMN-containing flavoprotein (pyridoxamine 5'-phosphate oxidase superfamily)
MRGELSPEQIDEILRQEILGRVGFVADGWPYVEPVTYVYDGDSVFVHSGEGLKLRALRENPHVCLEVEQINSMSDWRTVLVRGNFEQLLDENDEEGERALELLATHLARIERGASERLMASEEVRRQEGIPRPVLYSIRIEATTGRFELV